MFQAIILPIFRSTRLCVTASGIMHPRCRRPVAGNIVGALYHNCNTQSSTPEDGQNNCPKYVELTGIINKPLLFHLVGCLYYLFFIIFFRLAEQSQFIPLQNVVYFITLPFLVRKIFIFSLNDVLLFKCPFSGPKG
jgi:hypothetical protein